MVKPNKSVTAPSITSVLKKISDDKAFVLFNSIAVSSSNNLRQVTLKEMNLSTKQYYSRISGLQNAGLIKRHKGRHSLTLLGHAEYTNDNRPSAYLLLEAKDTKSYRNVYYF